MSENLILIPPSEGKAAGGDAKPLSKKHYSYIMPLWRKLKALKVNDASKIYGVSGKNLERAIEANQRLWLAPTCPAVYRYTGVVYDAIDYKTLSTKAQAYFDQHVRIVSGLFGLLQPQDLIPDYKFKIDKLGATEYWRDHFKELKINSSWINLLPKAHGKCFDLRLAKNIEFYFVKDGKNKPAGHHGKHIKGRFIRYLCQEQSMSAAVIRQFNESGFVWKESYFVKIV